MARHYTDSEMARRYLPIERMAFGRGGHFTMTAETAERLTYGLVEIDRGVKSRAIVTP